VDYYVNLNLEKKYWDAKKCKIKASAPQHIYQYNTYLDTVLAFANKLLIESKISGILYDKNQIVQALDQRFKNKPIHNIPLFQDYALNLAKLQSAVAVRRVKNILTVLPDNCTFDYFNHITILEIKNIITQRHKPSSAKTIITQLKSILNHAKDDGYYNSVIPKSIKDTVIDHVYLTQDDIILIENYSVNGDDDKLVNTAKLWLIMYYTGCRYQNIKDILSPSSIIYHNGEKYLRYKQIKTNKYISLPYHQKLEIAADNARIITNQKMNDYIKELCQILDIHRYSEITNHTARRSCITNLVLLNMPLHLVMKISGHKTETELMRYVKYNDLTAAVKIKDDHIYNKWMIS
jgi:hypothetical protein